MKFSLLIVISFWICASCQSHKIALEKVSYLPDYFSAEKHFGTDIRSMDEENEFILVTGYVDTTSEGPPPKLAAITFQKNTHFLNIKSTQAENGKVDETYSGDGYNIELNYRSNKDSQHGTIYEGTLVVKHDGSSDEIKVVGTPGYH